MAEDFNDNNTLTGICNSALAMVGETRFLADIEDGNDQIAKILRIVFRQVCKEIQSHEFAVWNELTADVELVRRRETEESGVFNGTYQYNLPLHMCSPVECYDEDCRRVPFEIIGNYLHCRKERGVRLRFIRFSFDPSEWSTELQSCTIKLLSARIVASIVKDFAMAQKLEQQFWAVDYPFWAGCKKNKSKVTSMPGNDAELTGHYPPERGGMNDFY